MWQEIVSFYFIFSNQISKVHLSQAFWQHQACQIPTLYKPLVNFCLKQIMISFFNNFWGALVCNHVVESAQGQKCRVPKKKFVLPIESWILKFIFFNFCFCSWFCMISSSMWLLGNEYERFEVFRKIYKFHGIGIFSDGLLEKNTNSTSLIIINLKLRFEACVINLIQEWSVKDLLKKNTILFS